MIKRTTYKYLNTLLYCPIHKTTVFVRDLPRCSDTCVCGIIVKPENK